MQKWFILRLGVLLLGSCLCAAAQTPATQIFLIREPVAPPLLARTAPLQLSLAPVPPTEPVAKEFVGFTVVLVLAKNPRRGINRPVSVDVVKTMFAVESRVPIIQSPSGRLQLSGFARTHYMGNVLLGPSPLGHPGLMLPRSPWAYGISLNFRLGRDSQKAGLADGWRRLAQAVGSGRGDHI